MYSQAEKAKENKSQTAANGLIQTQTIGKPTFQFEDNRPEAVAQKKLQEMANNSFQVKQLMAIQEMTNCTQVYLAAPLQTTIASNATQNNQPVQCLLAGEPVDLISQRCLDFETHFDNQTNRLPLRFRWPNNDHPEVETAREQYQLARADLGVDNRGAIEAQLDIIETSLAALRKRITIHLEKLNKIAPVLEQFAVELGADFDDDLDNIRTGIYDGPFSTIQYNNVTKNIYKRIEIGNRDMQKLRANNAGNASALVRRYISAGLINIGAINKYYCSPYDHLKDRFGAKASVSAGGSGAMQWARTWEFHIHGEAIRAGGPNAPVTSFRIARGHIKPTAKKMDTGISIEIVDPGAIAAITNSSMAKVVRWANGAKAKSILTAQ